MMFLVFCSFCFGEEIQAEKWFKNGRGREKDRGERPGEVAPERTGLLDMTTRDGPEHDRLRRRPHCR
jgi:hypothetical protein